MLKANNQFFDNTAIDAGDILANHVQATGHRLTDVPVVLSVQDTTQLDWTHRSKTLDLGAGGGEDKRYERTTADWCSLPAAFRRG